MSDPRVVAFRPEAGQYAWTFGGAAPVARIEPGTILELWTEDCFAGRVRSRDDLVSQVCEFPFLDPQTGPFYVEGAEPGDTIAVHFVSIEPARDRAAVRGAHLDAPDRHAAGSAPGGGVDLGARPDRAAVPVRRAG